MINQEFKLQVEICQVLPNFRICCRELGGGGTLFGACVCNVCSVCLHCLVTYALIGFLPFCTIMYFDFRSILQPGTFSDVQTNFTYEETVRLVSKGGW